MRGCAENDRFCTKNDEYCTKNDGIQLAADRQRFPSGNGTLALLAAWLHENGDFLLGVYTAAGNETCSTGGRRVPGEPNARGVPGSCDGVTAAVCLPQCKSSHSSIENQAVLPLKNDDFGKMMILVK